MASRILGMGDMLSLIEKAEQQYDEKKAAQLEEKLRKNRFTLTDYLEQMQQLRGMGDLSQLAGMMPGQLGRQMQNTQVDEKLLKRQEAIILSMTPRSGRIPASWPPAGSGGVAAGCGLEVADVNRLLKQYDLMLQLTRQFSKGKIPKGLGGLGNIGSLAGLGKGGGMSKMHGFGRKKRLK